MENNDSFMIELIATLNRALSKKSINNDLRKLDNTMHVKVLAKLSKALARRELNRELKELNNLYIQVGNVKIGKDAKDRLQRNIMALQQQISDIEIGLKMSKAKQAELSSEISHMRDRLQEGINSRPLELRLQLRKEKLISDVEYLGKRWSKLFSNASASKRYEEIMQNALSISDERGLADTKAELAAFTSELKANGLASKSASDKWKSLIDRSKELFSAASAVRIIFSQIRSAISVMRELDTAMTDVYKVSDGITSRDQFSGLLSKWNRLAQDLSVTTASLVNSMSEWSKIGFSLDISEQLAEITAIFERTAEISNEQASKTLISAAQAFTEIGGLGEEDYVERVEAIASKINKIGDRYAISSAGIAEALQNSSAALRMANNNLDESIALIATANKIYQSPSEVGNMLKVVSARIRGQKGELEALNEDVDGVIEGVSKVQTQILNLTKGRVNIFEDDNETLKSTYEIMLEIGKVMDSLSDRDSASLLEIMFGKQRMSSGASLLMNFKELEKVKSDSMNSAGSMAQEYNKYLESAEAHIVTFKEKLVEAYSSFVSGDTIKYAADLGSALLDIANHTDLIRHTLLAVAAINAGKGISAIGLNIAEASRQMSILGDALQKIKNLPTDDALRKNSLNEIGEATKSLTEKNLQLLLSQKQLSEKEAIRILKIQGLSKEEAKNKLEKLGLLTVTKAQSAANIKEAATTGVLKGAMVSLKTSVVRVGTAIKAAFYSNPLGFVLTALVTTVSLASSLISKHKEKLDEARESSEALTKAMSDFRNEVRDGNKTLASVSERYEELRKGVDSLGRNVSLTSDEYSEYLDICNQLAELMPDMVSYWNDEGDAIIDTTKSISELTEAYRESMRVRASQFLLHGDGDGNTVESIAKNYRNVRYGDPTYFEWTLADPDIDTFTGIHGHRKVLGLLEEAYSKGYEEFMQMVQESAHKWASNGARGSHEGALAALLKQQGYKANKIKPEDFGAIHDMLYSTITALREEEDEAASQVIGIMQQMLLSSREYSSIKDGTLQDSIQRFIQSISSDFIALKGLDTTKSIRGFVNGFVSAASDADGELAKALVSLFDADATADGVRDALSKVGDAVGADTDMLSEMLGLDGILKSESRIKVMLSDAVDRILKASGKTFSDGMAELRERGNIYDALEEFMGANGIDTTDRMTLFMRELEKAGYDMQEAFRNYAASVGELADSTFSLTSHSEAIDSFQSRVKSLSNALTKLNNGEITSSDLTDLAQEFTSLDVASGTLAADIELLIYDSLRELYKELGNPPEGLREALAGIADEALEAANSMSSLSSSIQSAIDIHSLMSDMKDDMEDGKISAVNLQKIAASYEGMEEAVVAYSAGLIDSKELYKELGKQYEKDLDAFRAASQSKAYESEMYYSAVLGKEQALTDRMRKLYGIDMSEFRTAEEAKTAFLERSFGDREAIWDRYYRVVQGKDGTYELRATGNLDSLTGTNRTAIENAKAKVQQFLDDLNRMFRADFDLAGMLVEEAEEAESKNTVFDWIETKLENIQRKIRKFGEAVSDAFSVYTDRKDALSDKINATVSEQLPALEEALEKYKGLANSVELDEQHKERVRNGEMMVEFGTDSTTADRISEYEKWHNKALDTQEAIEECRQSLKELNEEWLSLEEAGAKGNADTIMRAIEQSQMEIEKAAYSGADTSSVYDTIIAKQGELAEAYREGAEAMQSILSQMEAEGIVERHSEKWDELTGKIDSYISLAEQAELAAKKAAEDRFADISARHGRILARHEHEAQMLDRELAMAKEKGYLDTAAGYSRLIENEVKILGQNMMKRHDLEYELALLTNAGVTEGSERWHELNAEILSTNEAIADSELKVTEWANAIRQVKWDTFDFMHDQIAKVSDEADFLIKLMEGRTHEENGQLTDAGLASAALHKSNYDLYTREAQAYAEELERIEAAIEADPDDTENIKRWGELAEARRNFILAAEEEKQAIIDLVAEGISLELESLKELTDEYGNALDAQKDLYDYQKKTASQTKDIAKLQKLLSAYEKDASEETRAKIQKFRVQLEEAQSGMEDYQYDRYISEQKELLSSLYESYKETLEKKLEDTEKVFQDMADEIGANADTISSAIKGETDKVNYQVSQRLEHLWGKLDDAIDSGMGGITDSTEQGNGILSWIGGNISDWKDSTDRDNAESNAIQTEGMAAMKESVDAVRASVDSYFAQMLGIWEPLSASVCRIEAYAQGILGNMGKGNGNAPADGNAGSNGGGNGNGTQQKPSNAPSVNFIPKNDSVPKKDLDTGGSIIDMLKWHDYDASFAARKKYYREMGYTDAYYGTDAQNRKMLSWMEANGYANGMYRAGTGEPKVIERISIPSIQSLQAGMARTAYMGSPALGMMSARIQDTADSPMWDIDRQLPSPGTVNQPGGTTENSIDVQFVFPNVMGYSDFMREAQKDQRFEKMVQDMTINRLAGAGVMDKYRHRF